MKIFGRVSIISFFMFCASAVHSAPYYLDSIGPDHNLPHDQLFHSIIDYNWFAPGLLREAHLEYQKNPQKLIVDPEWEKEARELFKQYQDMDHRSQYKLRETLVQIMDSPQTDPKLRSLVEHYYVGRSRGWIEAGKGFQAESIKMFLIRKNFLKLLLHASGKSDSEKIKLIDNFIQGLETFHSVGKNSHKYRYIRIANKNDREEFLKTLNDGYNFLNDEFKFKSEEINLPAGVLGDEREIRELRLMTHYAADSKDFSLSLNLYLLDRDIANKAAEELNEKAAKAIQEKHEASIKGMTTQTALDAANKVRDHALSSVPVYTELKLQNLTIVDLAGADGTARKYFSQLSDKSKLELFNKSDEVFKSQWMKIRTVAEEVLKSDEFKFSNKADERFFYLLISNYFGEITYEESKNIIKSLIERPDLNSAMSRFRLLILHAGPQMQKLVQILGHKKEFSKDIQSIFNKVEDQGLETPFEYAKNDLGLPPRGFKWVSLEKNAKVGSIAQTYEGVVEDKDSHKHSLAVRVKKDGIDKKFSEENQKISRLAKVIDEDPLLRAHDFPLITPILSDIRDMGIDELALTKTEHNQLLAAKYYRGKIEGKVVKTIEFMTPDNYISQNSHVLYSSWVRGEKFSTFAQKYPKQAIEIGEAIATYWLEKALYTDLFFHTDLHQGNLKIDVKSNDHIVINFLDFGMVGQFTPEVKDTILKLSVARFLRNEESIADYLWFLSNSNENLISKDKLLHLIKNNPDKFNFNSEDWMEWALSKGIKLRREVTAFSRGITAIGQLLEASGSKKSISDILGAISKRNYGKSFELLKGSLKDRFWGKKSQEAVNHKCDSIFIEK